MTAATTIDRLTEALAGPLAALGLDLEAVDLSAAGKRRVLRVAVDKDGGVELDEIAEATREISRLLDEGGPHEDVMGQQAYTLEVSSPGVDRPLTLPRHWRRNLTRLVKVTRTDGTVVEGRIAEAGEQSATLAVTPETAKGRPSAAAEPHEIAFADVAKALIQIEFKREG